jgi:hypothetical protein
MKFIAIAISAIVGLAAAQSSDSASGSSSAAATSTRPLTPQESCLQGCAAGDVNCQAICVGVPHPGTAQVNATTDCVAKCDQGDGSAAAAAKYADCRNACISSYIITSGTAAPGGDYSTPVPPGVTVSTTATSSAAGSSGKASGTGSASGSATGSGSSSSSSGAAVPMQIGSTGGLAGLLLAGLAML